jgi:hypothetical protein
MIFSKLLDHWLPVAIFLVACATPLCAQQQLTRPKVEGKVILGSVLFEGDGDEDIEHKAVGAALRVYVTKRVSIEPEYLYMRHSDNDQDHIIQPNIAYDFTDPTKRLVAYGIAGAGLLHHRDSLFGRERSSSTWTASAGGGLKIFLTNRLFVSPEIRVGREPSFRATINVGYVFVGKR